MYNYGPIIGFILTVVVALFYTCFFIVPEGKQALVLQFGEVKSEPLTNAGWYLKLPWRKARLLEKRILNWDGRPEQAVTKDKKYIIVDTTARWRIVDTVTFIQKLKDEKSASHRIKGWIDSATKQIVAKHNLVETVRDSDEIIKLARAAIKGPSTTETEKVGTEVSIEEVIEEEIASELESIGEDGGRSKLTQEIIDKAKPQMEPYGVELIDVQLKRVSFEETVQIEVYKRMITERQRIAKKIRSIGKGEQSKIRGRASKELQAIESGAYKRVQEIKGNAEAKAIKLYADAIRKDPGFYEFLRTTEAYRDGLRSDTKLILSSNTHFLKFLQEGPHSQRFIK